MHRDERIKNTNKWMLKRWIPIFFNFNKFMIVLKLYRFNSHKFKVRSDWRINTSKYYLLIKKKYVFEK